MLWSILQWNWLLLKLNETKDEWFESSTGGEPHSGTLTFPSLGRGSGLCTLPLYIPRVIPWTCGAGVSTALQIIKTDDFQSPGFKILDPLNHQLWRFAFHKIHINPMMQTKCGSFSNRWFLQWFTKIKETIIIIRKLLQCHKSISIHTIIYQT